MSKPVEVRSGDHEAYLIIRGRNGFIAKLAVLFGAPIGLFAAILSIANVRAGEFAAGLAGIGTECLVALAIYLLGFRRRAFRLRFDATGIHLQDDCYRYVDIDSYDLSPFGGGILLGSDGGPTTPRNVATGWHISISRRGQQIPLTVGLEESQAHEAFEHFKQLFERFGSHKP